MERKLKGKNEGEKKLEEFFFGLFELKEKHKGKNINLCFFTFKIIFSRRHNPNHPCI